MCTFSHRYILCICLYEITQANLYLYIYVCVYIYTCINCIVYMLMIYQYARISSAVLILRMPSAVVRGLPFPWRLG